MDKRTYFLSNLTSENIRVTELNLTLPPGISNLFELNPELTFEQIDYSLRKGTLLAAMENRLCRIVPDIIVKSISSDIILRNPYKIQTFPPRTKFDAIKINEPELFNETEDAELFAEENIKPARQLEEELNSSAENVQAIEATVKEANLPEKPIEHKYTPPPAPVHSQEKIKNDMTMGYETCHGYTADGKRCMRRAKTGKGYCGLHKNQNKTSV